MIIGDAMIPFSRSRFQVPVFEIFEILDPKFHLKFCNKCDCCYKCLVLF
jgi:hypothetical protein